MKTISYIPSKDELLLKFRPLKRNPTEESGRFKFWWDEEGNIYGISIMQFVEEVKEFKKYMNTTKLGGLWRGIKISNQDIKKIREDMLRKLEEKW